MKKYELQTRDPVLISSVIDNYETHSKKLTLFNGLLQPIQVSKNDPSHDCTVKPVLSGHSKIDKTKILVTNGSLMQVRSIAECS